MEGALSCCGVLGVVARSAAAAAAAGQGPADVAAETATSSWELPAPSDRVVVHSGQERCHFGGQRPSDSSESAVVSRDALTAEYHPVTCTNAHLG